ncbi:MAG: PEP-utilizing enzyme [Halobacteriales archaeon]|nr:PEP-utilizing enzyme [Halobacteriales archaeon]
MTDEVITTGKTASPGKASGTVRVVERDDATANEELPDISGDVLLTDELLPSLIPLAEDATAIPTYATTSLTSKAAMVARENDVPCLVGLESVEDIEDSDEIVIKTEDEPDTRGAVTGKVLRA